MPQPKFRFVVATRASKDEFFRNTALGKSLSIFKNDEIDLYAENSDGLSTVYNRSIKKSVNDPAILIFIHDDIWLLDFFWSVRIISSLRQFDIVGIVGAQKRSPRQFSWAYKSDSYTIDRGNLSGLIGHGKGFPPNNMSYCGQVGIEVEILDGVFIACKSEMLQNKRLKFDERFDFHFYDMDFCRSAELKGLKMGTSPISVIHESAGVLDTPSWDKNRKAYFEKWGD